MKAPLMSIALGAALLLGNAYAADHSHEHHHAPDSTLRLTLNQGQKWPTDAPLRRGMSQIRSAMAGAHEDIHHHRLSQAGYTALAKKIQAEVATLVAECNLPPEADAQLHQVIAQITAGAETLSGKQRRHDGAVRIITALEQYGSHFDHPGWQPLTH